MESIFVDGTLDQKEAYSVVSKEEMTEYLKEAEWLRFYRNFRSAINRMKRNLPHHAEKRDHYRNELLTLLSDETIKELETSNFAPTKVQQAVLQMPEDITRMHTLNTIKEYIEHADAVPRYEAYSRAYLGKAIDALDGIYRNEPNYRKEVRGMKKILSKLMTSNWNEKDRT